MKTKSWLIPLVGLTLALAGSSGAAYALTADGTDTPERGLVDDPAGDQPPVRSDDGIDPNECNLVHNINACDDDELGGMPEPGADQGVAITSDGDMTIVDGGDLEPTDGSEDGMSPPNPPYDGEDAYDGEGWVVPPPPSLPPQAEE